MSDELNDGALRLAVAQICQSMGWDALQKSTHDLLTDVLQRYMQEMAKSAYDYSQLYCHTEPSLDDLELAFKDTGVLLHELEDFVTQVDQVPFSYELPWFPIPKANVLHHPHKEEIVDRPEFYHEHLPPLIKALQQHEDDRERDEAEIQGLENVAEKTFLRTEIKTVGKETKSESVEVTSDKRTLSSSMEVETESKRRRLEGPFGKHTNENKLDILQVLQEKNSQSLSHSPYPDFVNACTDVDNKHKESVFTPPTSLPETFANAKLKQDGIVKKEKTLIHQSGQIVPELKDLKEITKESSMKKTSDKLHVKSPQKSKLSPSKMKQKTNSPVKTPTKPSPPKKSARPQVTFSKPKSIKKVKAKISSPGKVPNVKSPIKASLSSAQTNPNVGEATKSENVPKLIIKPVRLEKSLRSEYSVLEIPAEYSNVSEMETPSKTKVTIKHEASPFLADEPKPKKKRKKETDSNAVNSSRSSTLVSTSSTRMVAELHSTNKVTDSGKKKKKKHREKEKGKNKKKAKEPTCEPLFSDPSVLPIPTIKLKLEAPSNIIPSEQTPDTKPITCKLKKARSQPVYSTLPTTERQAATIVKQEEKDKTQLSVCQSPPSIPGSSSSSGLQTKDDIRRRTVITETLSTTVQVFYCPACGLADDGSFMIGCDTCDSWYHGACVGIINDPGGDWYCEVCRAKKAKKKKKKKSKDRDQDKHHADL